MDRGSDCSDYLYKNKILCQITFILDKQRNLCIYNIYLLNKINSYKQTWHLVHCEKRPQVLILAEILQTIIKHKCRQQAIRSKIFIFIIIKKHRVHLKCSNSKGIIYLMLAAFRPNTFWFDTYNATATTKSLIQIKNYSYKNSIFI